MSVSFLLEHKEGDVILLTIKLKEVVSQAGIRIVVWLTLSFYVFLLYNKPAGTQRLGKGHWSLK